MPSVAAGAVLSGVFAGSSIAAGIGFSWAAFAGSLILGGLSYALTPKPKKPAAQVTQETPGTVAVRQSDLTRTYVYGHTRVVRGYAHMESTNENKDLHLILMLCEGELRAINEIWVNDYCIPNDWINSDGTVTQGRYAGYLTVRKHLGSASQEADSLAVANMAEWTANHRLQGIAYLYIIMNKNQDVYPTGVPNITAIVEGPTLQDPRIGDVRWSTNMGQFAYDFISDSKGYRAAVEDTDLTNISAQMNICDEIVATTAEAFTVSSIDTNTEIITLQTNLLTLQFGDRVQVTSTGSLPGGISALTDYYVIPYQIKDSGRILLATSLQNSMAKIAIDITSAGSGVITVTKNGEPRYHGGGEVDSATDLSEVLNNLVNSMAGRAINIAGAWTLLAGAWRSPVLEFTIGDMRGNGIAFKNCLSMSESFNIVKGLFSGAPTLYQNTDYPAAIYSSFINRDMGIESPKEINLPFTTRPTTAQRIAKIELFRGQQQIAVTCDFSLKAMQAQPGDVVELTIDRLGWEQKEFEITEFTFDSSEGALVTKLVLRETAQEIYDWSAGEAIYYDPAPNTNLPNPFFVQAVSGLSYDSRFVETRGGDAVYSLQLEWVLHPDGFVREFGQFEVQFKPSAEPDWLPSFFVDGMLTQTDVVTASVGTYYDMRIRAVNSLGVRSGWNTIEGAIAGSSGGVGTTLDYGLVTEIPASTFLDYGSVADAPTTFEDYEFVN